MQHDWHVSDKDVLGAIANVRFSDSGSDSGNGSTISDYRAWGTPEQELYSVMLSNNASQDKGNFIYANLNYTHTFDESRAAELTLNADYSRNASREFTEQTNIWKTRPSSLGLDGSDIGGNSFEDYGFQENTGRVLDLISLKADYTTVF